MRIFAKIDNLVIYQADTLQEICEVVSRQIIALVNANRKRCNIGIIPSRWMYNLYDDLVIDHNRNRTSYKHVHFYCLNEYVAMQKEVKYLSNAQILNTKLFRPLKVKKRNTFFPNENMSDYEFSRYDRMIWADGGLNLSLIDLGDNGQIAFNEANTSFTDLTRMVLLSDELRKQKSFRFDNSYENTPTLGVTASLQTIMNSEQIIVIASGTKKIKALKEILDGKYNPKYPCTYLINHRNTSIYIDKVLADALNKLD